MNKTVNAIRNNIIGILVCLIIAIPSWFLGKKFPIIGGAVIAILAGMIITMFWNNKGIASSGIKFTSKYILQLAVILLGFGLDLNVILETGKQSLPIIICTISIKLLVINLSHRYWYISTNIAGKLHLLRCFVQKKTKRKNS